MPRMGVMVWWGGGRLELLRLGGAEPTVVNNVLRTLPCGLELASSA
jgi:hypothetical protein